MLRRVAVPLVLVLAGCTGPPEARNLLRAGDALVESSVAGRDTAWFRGQVGKGVRINDVTIKVLPASPPSRLVFKVDVPEAARLTFTYAVAPDRYEKPGVTFAVKIREKGAEKTLWSETLDPLHHPKHRHWMPGEVDLASHAGRDREILLETKGEVEEDDPKRAYWGAPVIESPAREAPLVIVYLVDTLRADHTQPYGYARDTTPHLLEFARDAVVFEKAIAHASWTKPSVASLFTSRLPGRHRAVQLRDQLDPGQVTLAEMLESQGIATGAAIANSVIYQPGVNFDQGFEVFMGMHGPEDRPSKEVPADRVVDAALGLLAARRGVPTFLYVHTMDPHVPYTPPAPFDRKYEPYPTPDHPAVDPRSDFKEPADRERMMARYDAEIAYGDQEFGRFVRTLKERGLYSRALLVFMADHGEEFQDHGGWLHGRSVFDELVHIPLLVKFPGQQWAGKRVAQQVAEADVLPTVLETLELPVPSTEFIVGRPLQAVLRGEAKERPVLSEISHRGFVAHGLRTAGDKYVRRFSPQEDELYFDLGADPKEQHNRIADQPERVRRMRQDVEEAMVRNAFRYQMKVVGPGPWALRVRTGGWIDGVQTVGLGPEEKATVEGNGRKLALLLKPRPGTPREVEFTVRPQGVPVWLEGTKAEKPLVPADVLIAKEGLHPEAIPCKLPEIEPAGDNEPPPASDDVFSPPAPEAPGVHLWLTPIAGATVLEMSREVCEQMLALGYVGSCK